VVNEDRDSWTGPSTEVEAATARDEDVSMKDEQSQQTVLPQEESKEPTATVERANPESPSLSKPGVVKPF